MNNQTQIEGKNNTTKSPKEPERRSSVRLTRETKDALGPLALALNCESCRIVEGAIRGYLDFANDHDLAWQQPRFKNCDEILHDAIGAKLANKLCVFEQTSGLAYDQIAEIAVRIYIDFANEQRSRFPGLLPLLVESPGEIAPEQIEYMLSRVSRSARSAFQRAVTDARSCSFDEACERLRGLLDFTTHHPGFEQERIAVEMIVEGAARIS